MQPLSYLGNPGTPTLDDGLPTELAKVFQLTEIVQPWLAQQDSKWAVTPWSRPAAFPELPGSLLATTGFDTELPWAKTWAYPILDNPLSISQSELEGLARAKRVVCPTEALAELLADGLGYRPGVVRPGVPTGKVYNAQSAEYGREELRAALWTGVGDEHLVIIADWHAGADELVAAVARIDQPRVRLIFREWGPIYQPVVDQLLAMNNLDNQVLLTPPWKTDQHDVMLFNAADLYIPAKGWSPDIELAMACGCIPCVPDIDFWAERVDQQRGVELPTYCMITDEGTPWFNYDPHGVAEIINQLSAKELRQRRMNCLAWAQDPLNSWQRKVVQWAQILAQ